jgi:uncharacterized protein YabE (DUF348 family)
MNNINVINEIQVMPTIDIEHKRKKYVLIANDGNKKTPIKYSNNVDELLSELDKIMNESVFKFKKIKENMIASEDLGLTYEIILSMDLFK